MLETWEEVNPRGKLRVYNDNGERQGIHLRWRVSSASVSPLIGDSWLRIGSTGLERVPETSRDESRHLLQRVWQRRSFNARSDDRWFFDSDKVFQTIF